MGFAVTATTHSGHVDSSRTVAMTGHDPYGLTAIIAVQTALDVVTKPRPGARAPLEVLSPQRALAALADAGVRWTVA